MKREHEILLESILFATRISWYTLVKMFTGKAVARHVWRLTHKTKILIDHKQP